MTREERDAKIKALPKPLRKIVQEFDRLDRLLWKRIGHHEQSHAHCCFFPGCRMPKDQEGGRLRDYCPIVDTLMATWMEVRRMLDGLEWFLLDGKEPQEYRREWGPPASPEATEARP